MNPQSIRMNWRGWLTTALPYILANLHVTVLFAVALFASLYRYTFEQHLTADAETKPLSANWMEFTAILLIFAISTIVVGWQIKDLQPADTTRAIVVKVVNVLGISLALAIPSYTWPLIEKRGLIIWSLSTLGLAVIAVTAWLAAKWLLPGCLIAISMSLNATVTAILVVGTGQSAWMMLVGITALIMTSIGFWTSIKRDSELAMALSLGGGLGVALGLTRLTDSSHSWLIFAFYAILYIATCALVFKNDITSASHQRRVRRSGSLT